MSAILNAIHKTYASALCEGPAGEEVSEVVMTGGSNGNDNIHKTKNESPITRGTDIKANNNKKQKKKPTKMKKNPTKNKPNRQTRRESTTLQTSLMSTPPPPSPPLKTTYMVVRGYNSGDEISITN
jgi:hypothetical protein